MQREACRAFAAQHPDWEIIDEKYEKGISGFKVRGKDRDAVAELLVDAEYGNFDVLLVYMMDRLGRIADDTPVIAKTFASYGVEVWSAMEGQQRFDTQSDILMNYIRYWAAEGREHQDIYANKNPSGATRTGGTFPGREGALWLPSGKAGA